MKKVLFLTITITMLLNISIIFAPDMSILLGKKTKNAQLTQTAFQFDSPSPETANEGKGRCYCSSICGPRDVKEGDMPFFDAELGQCFCRIVDQENYKINGCDKIPKEEFRSACASQNEMSIDF